MKMKLLKIHMIETGGRDKAEKFSFNFSLVYDVKRLSARAGEHLLGDKAIRGPKSCSKVPLDFQF
jgi:hypothetical protein